MMQPSHDDRLFDLVGEVLLCNPCPRAAVVSLVGVAGAMAEYLTPTEREAVAMALHDTADEMMPMADTFTRRRRRHALYLMRRRRWRQLH